MSITLIATDLVGTLTFRNKEELFREATHEIVKQHFTEANINEIDEMLEKMNYAMYNIFKELPKKYNSNEITERVLQNEFNDHLKGIFANEVENRFRNTYNELRKRNIILALVSATPYEEILSHIINEIKIKGIEFDYIFSPKNLQEKKILDKKGGKRAVWMKIYQLLEDRPEIEKVIILDDTLEFIKQAKGVLSPLKEIDISYFLVGRDIKNLDEVFDYL